MSDGRKEYRAWGTCLDCGYEGLLAYSELEDERYGGETLAVVMLLRCPACGSEDHTLVPHDYYHELATGRAGDD